MGVARPISNLPKIIKSLHGSSRLSLRVGWFEGAKYQSGMPVAYAATINEYGYLPGGIPPRPFMRPTISSKKNEWLNLGKSGAKAVLAGNYTMRQVLDGIGLQAAGDIKKTISKLTTPELKPATISARKRKLSNGKKVGNLNKPLVETGLLIASLNHEVSKG